MTDPRGDVMSFIDGFNERYGPTRPSFYQGTYGEVSYAVKVLDNYKSSVTLYEQLNIGMVIYIKRFRTENRNDPY